MRIARKTLRARSLGFCRDHHVSQARAAQDSLKTLVAAQRIVHRIYLDGGDRIGMINHRLLQEGDGLVSSTHRRINHE